MTLNTVIIPSRALRVQGAVDRALDTRTSTLARCALASIVASYSLANTLDFSLRGLVSTLLLSNQASTDFSDAYHSLLLIAAALSYLFTSLFPPPPRETRIVRYIPPQALPTSPPLRILQTLSPPRPFPFPQPFRETRLVPYIPPEIILFSSVFAALQEAEEEQVVRSFVLISLEEIEERHLEAQKTSPPLLERLSRILISKNHPAKDMKYRHALQQMAACVEHFDINDFEGVAHQLLYALRHLEDFQDVRHQYWRCIELLRDACQREPSIISKTLAYARFAETNLSGYHKELVETASGPFTEPLSLATFKEVLGQRNAQLASLPEEIDMPAAHRLLQKLRGFLNLWFDPLMESNIPHLRALFKWSKEGTTRAVSLLRHGVPIVQTDLSGIVLRALKRFVPSTLHSFLDQLASTSGFVTPDYRAFVESNKRILHVIAEYGKERTLGDESKRVDLRMELQSYPNFFPLALPLDGSFFNTLATNSLETLQGLLIAEMKNTSSAFRFAEELEYQDELSRLFQEVREIFFADDTISSLATHQSYILLCYIHLIAYLQAHHEIDILEMGCKDDIDRGNILKTIFEIYSLILLGKENDSEALQTILISTLAAPLMVKKQGVIPSRFSLLLSVLEIFNQMTPQQKTALRNVSRDGWVLQESSLPFEKQQGLHPTASSAGTRQEYNDFLANLALENAWELPQKTENLVADLAKTIAFQVNGSLSKAKIFDQIKRDISRFKIFIGDAQATSPEEIENFLKHKGIPEEDVLRILSCCQQGMIADATAGLTELFTNTALNIQVLQDPSQDGPLEMHLRIDVQDKIAALHFMTLACIRTGEDLDEIIAKVGVSTTISDHRTGAHRHLVFAR